MQLTRFVLSLVVAAFLIFLLAGQNTAVSKEKPSSTTTTSELFQGNVEPKRQQQPEQKQPEQQQDEVTTTISILDELSKHGGLSSPTAAVHTPLDIVIPFDGELSPKQLELLLGQVKGKRGDAVGLTPQWNDQLRLTLRSLQKHVLCVPRNTSRLEIRTIHILLRAGSSLPSWLQFGRLEGTQSEDCQLGSLGSVHVRVESAPIAQGSSFNHFAMESQIASIPSLAPHFLYLPAGTVFTKPVVRKHLFELLEARPNERLLFPRATLPTEMQTPTVVMKRVHKKDDVNLQLLKTQQRHIKALHPGAGDLPTSPLLSSVHVVNTYLFGHYASGHSLVMSKSEALRQVSRDVQKLIGRDSANKVALASESVSPLVLHDAALIRTLALGSEATNRTLRHLTMRCWSQDAVDSLKEVYESMKTMDHTPVTLRLMPSLRHPFWMEQFLWHREAKALGEQTKEIAEIMGLSRFPGTFSDLEKSDVPPVPKQNLLFDSTRTFPDPQDPMGQYTCGPLRRRLPSTSLHSAGVVNDLLRAEPASSPRELPAWDAPEANSSASVVTIASMQCWYPGRPLHAFKDEVPEITAVPKLSERVRKSLSSKLDGHEDETSANHTVTHHRLATIDMVYTYVKGDAPNWLKRLRAAEASHGIKKDDGRIRDWDELRYSLRSVKKFVCREGDCCGQESGLGIGAIYIVMATEEHIPEWLTGYKVGTDGMDEEREAMSDEDKKNCRPPLRIITHEMIFPGAGNNPRIGEHTKNPELQAQFLPTFNSNAIESCLHRIPGLRSHFVYLNNDFMFGRNVFVNDFFRPVLHREQPLLEPLVPVEHIVGDLTDLNMGLVDAEVSPAEFETEAILFKSDPERYHNCENWAVRVGARKSLQAEMYAGVNQWTCTKYFNSMLVFDRLEEMDIDRKHSHLPMLFHRETMHKMQEVDFADISFHTRVGKFRAEDHLATEFMYIYYASAQRRARGTLDDPSFCANVKSFDYPHENIQRLYQRWNHGENYEIDRKWGYHWFYQVYDENLKQYIEDVKSGERRKTTFVSINDNFGRETDEHFEEHFKLFSELMDLLVSKAPRSWFEKPSQT